MSYFDDVMWEIARQHEKGEIDNRAWMLSQHECFEQLIEAVQLIVSEVAQDDIRNEAYQEGYEQGHTDGYKEGASDSEKDYDSGYDDGFTAGIEWQKEISNA